MDARDAVLGVLRAADEPLHWTVIQDRALRTGGIDPFATPNVRAEVLGALRSLVADGSVVKSGTGTYAPAREAPDAQGR
jgi:hypothetical protein